MMPVLFVIGGVPIYSHGFFLTLGVVACVAFFAYDARRRHLPAREALPIALGAFPGSILGGVVGAYAGGYIVSRSVGHTTCTCDSFAPAMALGIAVGRIGDFLSAEDGLGKATDLPWAVQAPGVDYLVHPAPLYDAAFSLVWFAIL